METTSIRVALTCETGKVRTNNEDLVAINAMQYRDESFEGTFDIEPKSPFFVAVADGMGGHNAGELASYRVITELEKKLFQISPETDVNHLPELVLKSIKEVHHILLVEGMKDSAKSNMGTTLTALFFFLGQVFQIHVGDSRLYVFRHGFLRQLSKDHSLREAAQDDTLPGNIILNSFGISDTISADIKPVKCYPGDRFLLCSDGLTDMLDDDEIENILNQETNSISLLAARANDKGGKDNISVVLIELLKLIGEGKTE